MPWSYSKLTRYEKCPYQLVLGKQFPQTPNAAMERGTAIHKDCENFLNDVGPVPNIPKFQEALEQLKNDRAKAELQWGLTDQWLPTDDFDNAWGKCIIDAFVYKPEQNYLIVIDFKTGKPSPISHQDQAQTYAIAAHCWYPHIETIHTQFWYLDKGSTVQQSYQKEHTDHYRTVLSARIEKMLNDDIMAPRPNKYVCRWCNYKEHCEYQTE